MPVDSRSILFTQSPPELANQFEDDWLLTGWLESRIPAEILAGVRPELESLGELAAGELYELQLADRLNEPRLTQWDAWGNRIDRLELTPLWRRAETLAASYGLVARGYESGLAEYARTIQFALAYLFIPSTDFYGCPLAMTDGAARILSDAGNRELSDRALPRLLSRDPDAFWTSGQWMTETIGGSDVSGTETMASKDPDGQWRLHGRKWFTSATTSQMALTLARPQGNPEGSRGLALFYVETRDPEGRLRNIEILRLKDKLGNRKVPTAELLLTGTPAVPVAGLERGVAAIAPMLNITRTWNGVTACALMRRGIALAIDYARRRKAFGRTLIDQPLHARTLGEMTAGWAVASCATFGMIEELGKVETSHPDARPELVRILTPVIKLGTAKQAIAVTSETLECFGGAGYVEDTGLPMLLRDAQVLSIWEGTTNVLALDLLRVLSKTGLEPWSAAMDEALSGVSDPRLAPAVAACRDAVRQTEAWLAAAGDDVEPGARGLGLTLCAATGLAWLIRLAQARLEAGDDRPLNAARLYASKGFPRPGAPENESCSRLIG